MKVQSTSRTSARGVSQPQETVVEKESSALRREAKQIATYFLEEGIDELEGFKEVD